jgi:hypothetical protein
MKYEDIKYKDLLFHQYLLDFFKDANYFIELKDTYYGYERYNIPANNTFSSVTENIINIDEKVNLYILYLRISY